MGRGIAKVDSNAEDSGSIERDFSDTAGAGYLSYLLTVGFVRQPQPSVRG